MMGWSATALDLPMREILVPRLSLETLGVLAFFVAARHQLKLGGRVRHRHRDDPIPDPPWGSAARSFCSFLRGITGRQQHQGSNEVGFLRYVVGGQDQLQAPKFGQELGISKG